MEELDSLECGLSYHRFNCGQCFRFDSLKELAVIWKLSKLV